MILIAKIMIVPVVVIIRIPNVEREVLYEDDQGVEDDHGDGNDDAEQSVGFVVHHVVEGHRLRLVCYRFGHNKHSRPSS